MALPLRYNIRNVLVRWRSTITTILGIALVVSVYVLMQAMAAGIEKSSANTGSPDNLLIIRRGSTAESSSIVSREQLRTLLYSPEIARTAADEPLVSADVLVLLNLPRRDGGGEANVLLRGVSPRGRDLRAQVVLVEGRWFDRGKREVVVSQRLAARFAGFGLNEEFRSGPATYRVVGHTDAGKSAFDSEVWMDADEARALFDREQYSSLLVRPKDAEAATNLIARLEKDKRLQLVAHVESAYYAKQTGTATPIKWLGNFLAIAMSVGAVFAAMNTMYAAVGARTREIGTLRVLGFRRRTVVLSFLLEGALLAGLGGALGCALSLFMNGYAVGTLNFATFSETVFEFRITPALMLQGLLFSIVVGILGTLLPALRASRLPVIAALKSL
ncbi:MAG: ABC transporter permease [Verrucomicrobiales bacterium]|nr:ABC transporter permease [Verrucomicrobiales bacterium]